MNKTVELHRTTKTTTILGLVFEGFGLVMMVLGLIFLQLLSELSINDLVNEGFSSNEAQLILLVGAVVRLILLVLTLIISVVFVINLWLFTNLIKQKYDYETAQKILLYQAIYGGVNLLFNQIAGVLYLISALNGRHTLKVPQETIREGL